MGLLGCGVLDHGALGPCGFGTMRLWEVVAFGSWTLALWDFGLLGISPIGL
jgi:hypothetical protein